MLLGLSPTEYENFIVAIESRDNIPKLESLKIKLKEDEKARQNERSAQAIEKEEKTTHYKRKVI